MVKAKTTYVYHLCMLFSPQQNLTKMANFLKKKAKKKKANPKHVVVLLVSGNKVAKGAVNKWMLSRAVHILCGAEHPLHILGCLEHSASCKLRF